MKGFTLHVNFAVFSARKQVVGEAVRECTEDFMFGRRLFGLVEELIEDEVTGSVGSIASGVYYSSTVRMLRGSG